MNSFAARRHHNILPVTGAVFFHGRHSHRRLVRDNHQGFRTPTTPWNTLYRLVSRIRCSILRSVASILFRREQYTDRHSRLAYRILQTSTFLQQVTMYP